MPGTSDNYLTFLSRCEAAASVAEIREAFLAATQALGFDYVALMSHVDPVHFPAAAVVIHHYPNDWAHHFSEMKYERFDPVFEEASRRATPFFWENPAFKMKLRPEQQAILNEASEAGISRGFTIPINSPDALPASCSYVPNPDGVDPLNYGVAHLMAVMAHEYARRLLHGSRRDKPKLRKRERECLALVAQGKSDWAISSLLNIAEKTVGHHVESAKTRLGVATRTQAVVQAMLTGEISIDEIAAALPRQ